ncbi:hypothetical protein BJX96DRAFT_173785 [Aspergillus floccosus]
MLGPDWEEGKSLHDTGSTCITATDFDLDALLVVLNAMHGRQEQLPRKLSLDMLANVAVVVDYYQCHGVVDMAKELWLKELKPSFPDGYSKKLTLWIWIAWVLRLEEEFTAATLIVIRQYSGAFTSLGFPIPLAVTTSTPSLIGFEPSNLRKRKSLTSTWTHSATATSVVFDATFVH